MIIIFAELWPHGRQDQAVPLGSIGIANVSQPGDLLDNYQFEIDEAPQPNLGIEQLQQRGVVTSHNRKQSVWKLVKRVLENTFPNIVT